MRRIAATSPLWSPAQSANVTAVAPALSMETGDGGIPVANGPEIEVRQSSSVGVPSPGGSMAVPAIRRPPALATTTEQSSATNSTATPTARRDMASGPTGRAGHPVTLDGRSLVERNRPSSQTDHGARELLRASGCDET